MRALRHLCVRLASTTLLAWHAHVATARAMRLEMLQAHAYQLALDQHLRRLRARVLHRIITGWGAYVRTKSRRERLSSSYSTENRYRRALTQWRLCTTLLGQAELLAQARQLVLNPGAEWERLNWN